MFENVGIVQWQLGWYSGYFRVAKWNKIDFCAYNTNRIVHEFYTKKQSNWYRLDKIKEPVIIDVGKNNPYVTVMPKDAIEYLDKHGSFRLGVDYYALIRDEIEREHRIVTIFPVALISNKEAFDVVKQRLINGDVIVYNVSFDKVKKVINFEQVTKEKHL